MTNPLSNQRVGLVVVALMLIAAGVVGVSKYKITSRPLPNLNRNTSITMPLPFENVTIEQVTNKQVRITTDKGDIVFRLDPVAGPLAARNFFSLAQRGYYDGVVFHRVDKVPAPFVIQGGDPTGTGNGGPGYQFPDDPVTGTYAAGTVAMANAGPDTNGSQFFIVLADQPLLPKNYSIFGQVTSGMEVVDQITVGDVMRRVTIEDAS